MTIWYYEIRYSTGPCVFEVSIQAIEVDYIHGFVYWADSPYIKQGTLNGSFIRDIISDTGKLNVTSLQISYVQMVLCYFASICTVYSCCLLQYDHYLTY